MVLGVGRRALRWVRLRAGSVAALQRGEDGMADELGASMEMDHPTPRGDWVLDHHGGEEGPGTGGGMKPRGGRWSALRVSWVVARMD
ncbi:hypothetical protein DK419_26870 [Methylobacterium terrae]|uniref:Uncharacterized protein n=1 Tax=Methylobacterium terrae TaxID=2202827 RepID=A0A2U8WTX0_9HYPH|nr:hypothetical protein DK419_26870 [Methylobacterium terrae]